MGSQGPHGHGDIGILRRHEVPQGIFRDSEIGHFSTKKSSPFHVLFWILLANVRISAAQFIVFREKRKIAKRQILREK